MNTVGATLNKRYRLDRQIGEGGFARVFLATDLELGRQVAVKVLERNGSNNQELLTRFRTEARAVALLDHPHILPIYDFGTARGAPYIVMPYMSGGTLADAMKRGRFTLDEVGVYVEQVSSALDYAHAHGIIHRDVKPSNLLLRPNGQLALMDFGLAKLLSNTATEVQTGVYGTVAYMAPEQFDGIVSAACDIYMLGVIFYQMLTGRLPYEGNTTQVINGHLNLTPDPLQSASQGSTVHPAVAQALNGVVAKALAKRPVERYPSGQALSNAFYAALNAGPKRAGRSHEQKGKLYTFDETLIERDTPVASAKSIVKEGNSRAAAKAIVPTAVDINATQLAPDAELCRKILLKPARLLVTTEPDKGYRAAFELVGTEHTLGRAKDNTLCLPLITISRHHAVIRRLNSGMEEPLYKIEQREPTNPLCFQGKKIREKALEDGDIIEIGQRGYAEYIVRLTYEAATYSLG